MPPTIKLKKKKRLLRKVEKLHVRTEKRDAKHKKRNQKLGERKARILNKVYPAPSRKTVKKIISGSTPREKMNIKSALRN